MITLKLPPNSDGYTDSVGLPSGDKPTGTPLEMARQIWDHQNLPPDYWFPDSECELEIYDWGIPPRCRKKQLLKVATHKFTVAELNA